MLADFLSTILYHSDPSENLILRVIRPQNVENFEVHISRLAPKSDPISTRRFLPQRPNLRLAISNADRAERIDFRVLISRHLSSMNPRFR